MTTRTHDDPDLARVLAAGHSIDKATDVKQMFQTGQRFQSLRIDHTSPWFGTARDLADHLDARGKLEPPAWR